MKLVDGHDTLTISPKCKKILFDGIDISSINLLKVQTDLIYDGKRIIWCRDFHSWQNFAENVIGMSGTWMSKGKSKQFTNSNANVMTWYPGKLNSLTFNGKDGESLETFLVSVLDRRTNSDASCLPHVFARASAKSKSQSDSVSHIQEKLSKVSSSCECSAEAIEEVFTAESSTLEEPEDFIDQSFQNVNVLTRNNNSNVSFLQSTICSTPVRPHDEAKSGITEKQFCMFKDKIESDIAVLINKLLEQTQIIN